MTRARNQIISTEDTPYYHCIARCVRRAFLCGEDPLTQRSFEHRRQWVIDRLIELQGVFCIDLCAYAIMSNHYHLVLCIDEASAAELTTDEVINRWCQLYKGPLLIQRYRQGQALGKAEYKAVSEIAETWRQRLADISWFMRNLNEHIARQANKEDGCKGHFWESRFKSQALLDDKALLTCMAYVDLNPVRAAIAETPESSDYTSVQARVIEQAQGVMSDLKLKHFDPRSHNHDSIKNHKTMVKPCKTRLKPWDSHIVLIMDYTFFHSEQGCGGASDDPRQEPDNFDRRYALLSLHRPLCTTGVFVW